MHKTGKVWGAVTGAFVLLTGSSASGAQAQDAPPGCVASNPGGAVAGALLGGVAGALLGNAVSGRHKEGGTIIGGVTGMAAGAAIGGSTGAPCPEGYAYRAVAPPVEERPIPVAREGDVWYGAPPSIRERIVFLRRRVEKLDDSGWLSPRESEGVRHQIAEISNREEHVRDLNDGRLPPEVRGRLFEDLNVVSRRLRWKEYRAEHAEE
jgi:hypothetical protein